MQVYEAEIGNKTVFVLKPNVKLRIYVTIRIILPAIAVKMFWYWAGSDAYSSFRNKIKSWLFVVIY